MDVCCRVEVVSSTVLTSNPQVPIDAHSLKSAIKYKEWYDH